MTTCKECNRKYKYNRKKGHTKAKCNSCMVNLRRFVVKRRAVAHLGGKCSSCGYSKCLAALHFHHVDASTKVFGIGGAHSRSWSTIEKELAKCILLCANCHAEYHGPVA